MVLVVVEEGEIVLRGIILCGLAVTLIKLIHVYPAVLKREAAAEQVVGGVKLLAKKFFHRLFSYSSVSILTERYHCGKDTK